MLHKPPRRNAAGFFYRTATLTRTTASDKIKKAFTQHTKHTRPFNMSKKHVIMVDASYFFESFIAGTVGQDISREELIVVNPTDLMKSIKSFVTKCEIGNAGDFLRFYWFEGVPNHMPSSNQIEIGKCNGVVFRGIASNDNSDMRGAYELIISDMAALTRAMAVSDIFLMTADNANSGMLSAIESAQNSGIRIHILAPSNHKERISDALFMRVDSVFFMDKEMISPYIKTTSCKLNQEPQEIRKNQQAQDDTIRDIAGRVSNSILHALERHEVESIRQHLMHKNRSIPNHIDRQLIGATHSATGREKERRFTPHECNIIRKTFIQKVAAD
jgi:hypothetical protein